MFVILALIAGCSTTLADTVCYEPCGCFSDDPPFDDRPLPQSPEDQEIVWLLYTQSNPDVGIEIHWDNIPVEYDPSNPTKFLIHGYYSSPSHPEDGMVANINDIKDAFLEKYDINAITVDWSTGARTEETQAASNTRVVGSCTGYLGSVITELTMVHCVGHSLGAHSCGSMGKFLEGDLERISGMDPSGPMFRIEDSTGRLDSTDARFVDVIHTNSLGFPNRTLGTDMPVGHVDIYVFNGGRQPSCSDLDIPDDIVCDHAICKDYYQASVQMEECTFLSYPCDSYDDGDDGLCFSCTEGVDCQSMGYYADTYPGRGTFYIEVDAQYPHCQN